MSVKKTGVSTPMSSAGILGISANENMGGIKFDPRGVVVFTALFIIGVKVASYLVKTA